MHSGVAYTNNSASEYYEVSQFFNLTDLDRFIDNGVANCWYRTFSPLTLIADGDMEASGTTDWTAVASASLSKITTSGYHGEQALRAANSGVNGGAQSATVNAVPSGQYYAQAVFRGVTVGTATLRAYDVTNAATIASTDITALQQSILRLRFTVPATAEQIALRLLSSGTSDDHAWDNVILYRINSNYLPLPTWITGPDQILGAYQVISNSDVPGGDILIEDNIRRYPVDYWIEQDGAGSVSRIHFNRSLTEERVIYLDAMRPFGTFPDDNTTSLDVNVQWAVSAAMVEFYKALKDRPGVDRANIERKLAIAERDFAVQSRANLPRTRKVLMPVY